MSDLPPIPSGFQIDRTAGLPPLPPGFQLAGGAADSTPAPSMATGLTKSFAEGAPIVGGLLNKGDAAFDALIAPYVNWMLPKNRQNTGKTFGERYQTSLDARERMDAAFERDHPYLKTAAEVAGGVAATGAAATTGVGAKALGLTANNLSGMAIQGAASGAAIGGADSAIRGGDAAEGALLGGVAGAGGPVFGRGLGAVADKFGRTSRAWAKPEQEAARQIGEALQKDAGKGLSPQELDAAAARGQPVALMDMGSRATQRLARKASNISPEAQESLDKTIGSRYRTQNDRTAEFLNTTFNYPNVDATQNALKEVARTVNRPAYAKAYSAGAKGIWSDDLAQLSQAPVVQDAIRKTMVSAKNEAAKMGFAPPKNPFTTDRDGRVILRAAEDGKQATPNLQFWDYVKRNLDATGTRESKDWARVLRDHLDGEVPEYANARAGAAKFFGADDALTAGQEAVSSRMGNRQIRQGLDKMSPVERHLFQDGFIDRYIQTIRESPDRRNVIDTINSSPAARERVLMTVGPQKAKELETYLRVEEYMDRARRAMGNSTTAQQMSDMKLGAMDFFDLKGAMIKMLHGASKAVGHGIDERVANKVAEMLTSKNEADFSRAIKLIANNKKLLSAIRLPFEAGAGVAARGATSGADANEQRQRTRGNVTVD